MILKIFLDGVDLAGTTVPPFVIYAVSGLAVRGEDFADAPPHTEQWLQGAEWERT